MGSHSSRRGIAAPLKQPTRAARGRNSPGTHPRQAGTVSPNPPLFGFAPDGVYRAANHCWPRGALLPHPFNITWPKPLGRSLGAEAVGNLLSVALSLGSPPPGVTRHPCFVEPGLSSPPFCNGAAAARPSGLSGLARNAAQRNQRVRPASRSSSSANRMARHSPSISPSMVAVRQRRWKAVVAARPSEIS